MFGFIKFYLLECVGYLKVANGRKPLLKPNIHTVVDSISPFLNRSLFWQPPEFGKVKENS